MAQFDALFADLAEDEQCLAAAVKVLGWDGADELTGFDIVKGGHDIAEGGFCVE